MAEQSKANAANTIDATAQPTAALSAPPLSLATIRLCLKVCEPPAAQPLRLQDPVFVCLDFEQWEWNQDLTTEIGVAVLDTKHIDSNAVDAQVALSRPMRFAHYRVAEYRNKVNKKFVKGCPENFSFGISQLISIRYAGAILSRVFMDPEQLEHAAHLGVPIVEANRNIVLVGHDLNQDARTAMKLGFSLDKIAARVDTQRLAGSTKKQRASLTILLQALGIEPMYLHNAGNDAAYTLKAMTLIALSEAESLEEALKAAMEAKRQAGFAAKTARLEARQKSNNNKQAKAET